MASIIEQSPHDSARASFADVIAEHQGVVFGYLKTRLYQVTDAEDLTQEVFLRFYRMWDRRCGAVNHRAWLIGIARNVLREHVRRLTTRREVAWTEFCLEADGQTRHEDVCEEARRFLPDCVEALSQHARQAIEWRYRDNCRLAVIAARLGRSEGAVKLLLFRSRAALKRCLERKLREARSTRRVATRIHSEASPACSSPAASRSLR